jgi:antitoxin (DNA-binding transcriptional repressor) of toxin-antitoxin stability system
MRTIEIAEATGSLSEYARQIRRGPLVVMRRGRPVAVVVAVEGMDLETLSLSTNADFIALIEKSRASYRANGGRSLEQVRRRYGLRSKTTGRRKQA